MKSNNAVGYIRVSTHAQTEGWSLEIQESEIRTYAQQHGLTLIKVYQDDSSGETDERPGFEKMIMDAYDGTFSTILIMNTSRMFRNSLLAGIYKNWLRKEMGIEVIFINQPTDHLDESTADLIESISDLFNEFHLLQLRAWTRAGLRARAMSGKWNGQLSFGYLVNVQGEAQIDPTNINGLLFVFQKYSTGCYSFQELATILNHNGYRTLGLKGSKLFTKQAIHRIIHNFFYIGFVCYKGDLLAGQHTPVISQELFVKCQDIAKHRSKHARAYGENTTAFIMAGIINCVNCEQSLQRKVRKINKKEYRYYRHNCHPKPNNYSSRKQEINAQRIEFIWGIIISGITIPKSWSIRIREYLSDPQKLAQLINTESRTNLQEQQKRLDFLLNLKEINHIEHTKLTKKLHIQEQFWGRPFNLSQNIDLELAEHRLQSMAYIWEHANNAHRQFLTRLLTIKISVDLEHAKICEIFPHKAFENLFENS